MTKSNKFKASICNLAQHYSLADKAVLKGLNDLNAAIANEQLAFFKNKANSSGSVWGRASVLPIFGRIFDPILTEIAAKSSYVTNELEGNNILLPLANSLKTVEDYKTLSGRFMTAAIMFDEIILLHPEKLQELIRSGESLNVIAELLREIYLTIQQARITWCKFCFRRAITNFKYCHIHFSKNVSSQDTIYRKAKRIFQSIDSVHQRSRESHRIQRIYGGENVLLMADNSPPRAIYPTDAGMRLPEHIVNSVENTLNLPWLKISDGWNAAIDECSEIRKRFTNSTDEFSSWPEFVSALFSAIDEPIETTIHPLWVLYIIKDAETWFIAESRLLDKRMRGTRNKALELYNLETAIADIAVQLNVSQKHVKQILQDQLKNSSGG